MRSAIRSSAKHLRIIKVSPKTQSQPKVDPASA
jgi:hypothetical protein